MFKKIAFLIFASSFLLSCSKEDGQADAVYTDSYRFYLYATVNGQAMNANAGEHGYIMHSNYVLQDSVLHMFGQLSRDSAEPREAVEIRLRSDQLITGSSMGAGNTFTTGPLALADPSGQVRKPQIFDFVFRPDSSNGHQILNWNYNGQTYYGDSLRINDVNIANTSTLNVTMTNSGVFSCVPMVKQTIPTSGKCAARLNLSASLTELNAEIAVGKGVFQSAEWWINGSSVSGGLKLTDFGINGSLPIKVKVKVHFEGGCTVEIEKTIIPGRNGCDLNITYNRIPERQPNPHNLHTAEIIYYDAAGKAYTTYYPNNKGNFKLESVSDYEENGSSGQLHKRIMFSGSGTLRAADGSEIEVENLYGSYAIAHP